MPEETLAQKIRRWINLGGPTRYLTLVFEEADGVVYVHIASGTLPALEESRIIQLGGRYWGRLDHAHTSGGKEHFHLYAKQKELLSINSDGTAHDRSHKRRIPNKAADSIREKLPHFSLPADNVTEWLASSSETELLLG